MTCVIVTILYIFAGVGACIVAASFCSVLKGFIK
jgi:hypothetical protein